jgi:hypothetical protein
MHHDMNAYKLNKAHHTAQVAIILSKHTSIYKHTIAHSKAIMPFKPWYTQITIDIVAAMAHELSWHPSMLYIYIYIYI